MTSIPVLQLAFYFFSALLIVSSCLVVLLRDLVKSALFLVLCFFAAAVLWMILQAEFLSLVLIFVYVGAVMTLFLFVVMMLAVDQVKLQRVGFYRFLPVALIVLICMLGIMVYALNAHHFLAGNTALTMEPESYDNVGMIGQLLYSDYIYPVEIVAAILLVAMISAIVLGFFGTKKEARYQKVADQQRVSKASRLRIINDKDRT